MYGVKHGLGATAALLVLAGPTLAAMDGEHAKFWQPQPRAGSTARSVEILKQWYEAHLDHPFPSPRATAVLATDANLTPEEVTLWLILKRQEDWWPAIHLRGGALARLGALPAQAGPAAPDEAPGPESDPDTESIPEASEASGSSSEPSTP